MKGEREREREMLRKWGGKNEGAYYFAEKVRERRREKEAGDRCR